MPQIHECSRGAAAIASGLCETVLITRGESSRSGVGRTRNVTAPTSLAGQFEQPYGPMGPPTLFTIPVLRYKETYGLTHDQLVIVSVVQREWAAKNPRVIPGTARQGRPPGDADHRRGCAELADDRLPVPPIAVLPGDRWRRRLGQAAALVTFNRRDFGAVPAQFGIEMLTPAEAIRRIRT